MNFIAMDFETATSEPHSACSIGLVMVKDSQIAGSFETLIRPETDFHWRNVQVHGIEKEDVRDAPYFPDVWQSIRPYFKENRLIVAHNAAFDNRVLKGCLSYYGIADAHFMSLCTVRTSKALYPQLPNHRLNTVSHFLDVQLENHHQALDDSLACASILLKQEETFGVEPLKKLVKHI